MSDNSGNDYVLDDNGYKIPVGDKYPDYPVELCDIIQGWKLACREGNDVALNKRRELRPPTKLRDRELYRKAGDDKWVYWEKKYSDGTKCCEMKVPKKSVERWKKVRAKSGRSCEICVKA